MLRKLRILVAVFLYVTITLSLLGILRSGWVAKMQVVPALLSLNLGVLIFLALLALVLGRMYCSVICPLGIWQDIVNWLARHARRKRKHSYSKPKTWLRLGVLGVGLVAFLAQVFVVVAALDPYGAYGRIVNQLLKPLYLMGKNALVDYNEATGWWLVRETFMGQSLVAMVLAAGTLLLVSVLAWLWGRTYCNTLCPVGTLLGLLSRYSLFQIQIDKSKCNHCSLCARHCKASCIDSKNQKVDTSRCVVCFDCLESCRQGAIHYGLRLHKPATVPAEGAGKANASRPVDASRRRFLATAAGTAAALPIMKAQEVYYETTQGEQWEKKITTYINGEVAARRYWPIMPPGAQSLEDFQKRCISCHLCVSNCPSHIIKPAVKEYGLMGVMQPTVSFEDGYCRPECNVCTQVCPTGALKPLAVSQKGKPGTIAQMGWANFNSRNCITQTAGVECGNCARHCPNKAIQMVEKDGHKVPKVIQALCTGCGACEYHCPARPKAIYVEGLTR